MDGPISSFDLHKLNIVFGFVIFFCHFFFQLEAGFPCHELGAIIINDLSTADYRLLQDYNVYSF